MAYQILINEEQKDMIRSALTLLQTTTPLSERHHEAYHELELLQGMFEDLKDDDSNYYTDPNDGKRKRMLHGFCL